MATVKHALSGKSPATDAAAANTAGGAGTGLVFGRYFTDGKKSPFDAVEWEKRTALIGNEKGVTIFRQEDVEVPKSWSQTATNIVTSKYFSGKPGTPGREGSVRQLISRVANTIVRWGEAGGYFANAAESLRTRADHSSAGNFNFGGASAKTAGSSREKSSEGSSSFTLTWELVRILIRRSAASR